MQFRGYIQRGIKNVGQNPVVVWLPWTAMLIFGSLVARLVPPGGWESSAVDPASGSTLLSIGIWVPLLQFFGLIGFPVARPDDVGITALGLAWCALLIFLDAGIVALLSTPILDWRVGRFFSLSAAYAGRFVRIFLIGLAPIALFTWARAPFASGALLGCALPIADCDLVGGISELGAFFVLAAISFTQAVACFARVQTVVEERTSMLIIWLAALRLVWRNPGVALAIASLQLAGGWVLFLLVSGGALNKAVSLWGTAVSGILLQGLLWVWNWLRAVTYGAQVELVQKRLRSRGVKLFLPAF